LLRGRFTPIDGLLASVDGDIAQEMVGFLKDLQAAIGLKSCRLRYYFDIILGEDIG